MGRAHTKYKPLCPGPLDETQAKTRYSLGGMAWNDIACLVPDDKELREQEVSACDVYPLACRALGMSIQSSSQTWQTLADDFTQKTTPKLQKQIWTVRSRITDDLSQMTRRAADEAD